MTIPAAPLRAGLAFCGALLLACTAGPESPPPVRIDAPWDSLVASARGTKVIWRMWRGDPAINTFVDTWVAPRMRERYGIDVTAVDGQGQGLVNTLVTEREARGATAGTTSLVWINGETFANLRSQALLLNGWTSRLPNAQWIDAASPVIARDFEQDIRELESPWGTAQFALIYHPDRTPDPPRSVASLRAWIHAHPGRFTHDQQFTGMTFLKTVMYALAGGVDHFAGGFSEDRYARGRDSLFTWLRDVRPAFWRNGETYPPDVAAMHRLFANGETDFTMSNNANEVVNKVRQGVLPGGSRALLLDEGTIANAHYVGIPFNAPNPVGAMLLADFLLSPEAQLEKLKGDVWGDGTVLDVERLPAPWPQRFARTTVDAGALSPTDLALRARPEVAPRYHERLIDDWRQAIRR